MKAVLNLLRGLILCMKNTATLQTVSRSCGPNDFATIERARFNAEANLAAPE